MFLMATKHDCFVSYIWFLVGWLCCHSEFGPPGNLVRGTHNSLGKFVRQTEFLNFVHRENSPGLRNLVRAIQ